MGAGVGGYHACMLHRVVYSSSWSKRVLRLRTATRLARRDSSVDCFTSCWHAASRRHASKNAPRRHRLLCISMTFSRTTAPRTLLRALHVRLSSSFLSEADRIWRDCPSNDHVCSSPGILGLGTGNGILAAFISCSSMRYPCISGERLPSCNECKAPILFDWSVKSDLCCTGCELSPNSGDEKSSDFGACRPLHRLSKTPLINLLCR